MTGQEFESHSIFDKLEQFKNRISENEIREAVNIDDIHFFETAYRYLVDRLNLTIPAIVQEAELTHISQEVENALSQINAFVGNRNPGHINNSRNNLHSAITRIRNLPLPFSQNDFNFSKSIAGFEKIVKEKHVSLEQENKALKESIKALDTELKKNRSELNRISTLLQQKEAETKTINSNFQTEFANIKAIATQNYESDRITFKTELDAMKHDYETEKASFNKDFDELKQTLSNEIKDSRKAIDSDMEKLIGV
ncbi:hypothetical protein SAMN05421747_1291 [Parapedobacter composti]|uniref:Uncharacterized protein n=1 Tax=Parapedobacter composti TaxID=623281 RepID=A0A1I1M511_9SPHI|nr:hypothetical protein [Parapedobacter composti]SFC80315.1 hypothetical protein SAMN05421747_1291 [Parapedobacter composti]